MKDGQSTLLYFKFLGVVLTELAKWGIIRMGRWSEGISYTLLQLVHVSSAEKNVMPDEHDY